MAIINQAGNFQPNSVSNGNHLPQKLDRAPSTSANPGNTVNQGRPVNQGNSVNQSNNEPVQAQLKPTAELRPSELEKVEELTAVELASVRDQIEELQQFNQNIDRSLQFEVDDELGVTIVRVIDKETDELIRQFPPEELINLSRRLKELNEQNTGHSGVLLREKV